MHLPLSRGGRGSMAETQYAFLGPEAPSSSEAKVKTFICLLSDSRWKGRSLRSCNLLHLTAHCQPLCKANRPISARRRLLRCSFQTCTLLSSELPSLARFMFKQTVLCMQPAVYRDPESLEDIPLVPGIGRTENALRWGFIKKVYGIVATQLLLTALVGAIIYTVQPVQNFVLGSPAFQITFAILPLVGERSCPPCSPHASVCLPVHHDRTRAAGLIPLYIYQSRHPWNLLILGAWVSIFSIAKAHHTGLRVVAWCFKPC